ncbi:MAG TPA: hydroxymethylbilane synthase [Oligoflexia bacterium]|nr:hydroxymethylbilane synthase [Oligoflexia bacterium]HMP27267.1 hydroxymethylbilane synthase [Oligoflexia bacterium]
MRIRIGSRPSQLSKLQALEVARAINNSSLDCDVSHFFRDSSGDLDQLTKLSEFQGKGVFTKDFLEFLESGEIDCVVHSWKDLPIEERGSTEIVATLKRADIRDVLLLKRSFVEDPLPVRSNLNILTSSPRREYNLSKFLPTSLPVQVGKINFESVRGNVETRIKKLLECDRADGLVVAKAALDRILLSSDQVAQNAKEYILREALPRLFPITLPIRENPAAAAQGSLAIEVLRERSDLKEALEKINHSQTFADVAAEREILKSYGGGCHQKIGVTVISFEFGRLISVRGLTDDGRELNEWRLDKFCKIPKAASSQQVWPPPLESEEREYFEREEIKVSLNFDQSLGIVVSRSNALPQDIWIKPGTIIWVAGDDSWREMVKRGVWVSGSSEGIGQDRLGPGKGLYDFFVNSWVKLTHKGGNDSTFAKAVASYELVPARPFPVLPEVTHYYWKSGSLFLHALKSNPAIVNCYHGCGPGESYQIIKSKLADPLKLGVFLNLADFYEEIL